VGHCLAVGQGDAGRVIGEIIVDGFAALDPDPAAEIIEQVIVGDLPGRGQDDANQAAGGKMQVKDVAEIVAEALAPLEMSA